MDENFKEYNKKAIFHIPGEFANNGKLISIFLNLMNSNPQYFYKNIEIGSVYGSPNVIWNGGRNMYGPKIPLEDLNKIQSHYSDLKIPVRFTFTNPVLKEYHNDDIYGNMILKIFDGDNNEIICNASSLEEYIRNNYDYKYISSTTKCLKNEEEIQNELNKEKYKLVVLDYNLNNKLDFLSKLENKNKLEILINAVCTPNCSRRLYHYKIMGENQLADFELHNEFKCPCPKTFFAAMRSPLFVNKEKINNFLDIGINNFKIEGRTTSWDDLLETFLFYFVKPEYIYEARFIAIQMFLHKE